MHSYLSIYYSLTGFLIRTNCVYINRTINSEVVKCQIEVINSLCLGIGPWRFDTVKSVSNHAVVLRHHKLFPLLISLVF